MKPEKQILLNHLVKYTYNVDEENLFRLSNGMLSSEYLDCKMALSKPRAMATLGKVFYDMLPARTVSIGGLTMGSDPIAMATSCWSAFQENPINWFSIRKSDKEHGTGKLIEGTFPQPGSGEVVLVDDVVTTGASTIKAIKALYQAEVQISKVIVLIDREEKNTSGMRNIKDMVYGYVPVESVFKLSDIRKAHKEMVEKTSKKGT